jgi:hypothetical protein
VVRYGGPGSRVGDAPGPAPETAHDDADDERCDVCGAEVARETYGLHCKIRCLKCGYTRDCSDP